MCVGGYGLQGHEKLSIILNDRSKLTLILDDKLLHTSIPQTKHTLDYMLSCHPLHAHFLLQCKIQGN